MIGEYHHAVFRIRAVAWCAERLGCRLERFPKQTQFIVDIPPYNDTLEITYSGWRLYSESRGGMPMQYEGWSVKSTLACLCLMFAIALLPRQWEVQPK